MKPLCRLLLLCSMASMFSACLRAQIPTTSLRGSVTDATQALLPGALIALDNAANGAHFARTSDAVGEYIFAQIPPGAYNVTVKAPGFATITESMNLLVNQPATRTFTLSVQGDRGVQINVSAEVQALNTTDATIGEAVDNATIEALPMEGRNVPDLLSLQSGVLYLGHNINANFDSRSGAVSGARSDQGNVTLDGLDDNDQVNGYAFTAVLRSTLDSVEEFRVTTANSNADTGRSSGAQVNMVTRSGTNAMHGALYEYNRNTLTSANNWFNKQSELSAGLPNRPGKLIRNTFGASLGGPIRKDKLFYFFNFESQRTAENVQQNLTVPTASFRAGALSYLSGGNPVSLTPSQVASMDPRCTAAGTCPLGPGADPNILAMLQLYPSSNGFVAGDGLNTASFAWSAPNPTNLNTSILKLDYAPSDKHRLFVRGNLQDDTRLDPPQFPGQNFSNMHRDNTRGVAAGYIWSPTANLVNNARYGFIRQGYSDRGTGQGSYVNFGPGSLSNLYSESRSSIYSVPVQNLVDDLSWTRGVHTLQFGVNYRLIHNRFSSNSLSYDSAAMTGYDVTGSGFAGTGQSFDPSAFGFAPVDSSFINSYNLATADLAGIVSQVTNQYNYAVSSDGSSASLADQGAFVGHDFKANEFEYYLQDSWRPGHNLTISAGLRHTLMQTPYEVHGQQVAVTSSLYQWFINRAAGAAQGVIDQPSLSFAPAGQARSLKPYWNAACCDLAPRIAIAYSPNAHTSVRAGFGMFYDHFGQGIVNSFSQYGSYGLQGQKQTPNDALTPDNAPRFSSLHAIPNVNGPVAKSITYPFTPSTDPFTSGFATAIGLDDKVHTPYSYTMDLSIQQELPRGFSLELAYVGRLGHHLLQQVDLAAPRDFVDPASGQDFYAAATALTKQVYAGAATVAAIPYFEDLFPDAAGTGADGTGTPGASATQNIYRNLFVNYPTNASYIQYSLDILCSPGCGSQTGRFYNPQFNSLFTWVSNGTSNYNALQAILRHPMSHGLQFTLSYTLSKSLDLGSDSQRACVQCGSNAESTFSWIVNAFRPRENYAVSDFDTRHLLNGNWVWKLPIGAGNRFAGGSGRIVNAFVGGWQLSGLARWTSGLPFTVMAGNGWEVDWSQESAMVKTGPVKIQKHLNANGAPQVFADPSAVLSGIPLGPPLRNPLPGEAGTRNGFRGDGYFGVDSGLSKGWTIHHRQELKFSWEVFNTTNSVRFDVSPLTSLQNQTSSGSFGVYGAALTQPRVQQFSVRYAF